jgi:hypothetical protein
MGEIAKRGAVAPLPVSFALDENVEIVCNRQQFGRIVTLQLILLTRLDRRNISGEFLQRLRAPAQQKILGNRQKSGERSEPDVNVGCELPYLRNGRRSRLHHDEVVGLIQAFPESPVTGPR